MQDTAYPDTLDKKQASSQKKLILLIDDNADLLDLNKTVLETEDFDVAVAMSEAEAFAVLSKITRPDLILLDMRMDDMSGPEFLLALEKTRSDIFNNVPVVFLSANDSAALGKAAGFIRKGTDIDKFLTAVHRFIDAGINRTRDGT